MVQTTNQLLIAKDPSTIHPSLTQTSIEISDDLPRARLQGWWLWNVRFLIPATTIRLWYVKISIDGYSFRSLIAMLSMFASYTYPFDLWNNSHARCSLTSLMCILVITRFYLHLFLYKLISLHLYCRCFPVDMFSFHPDHPGYPSRPPKRIRFHRPSCEQGDQHQGVHRHQQRDEASLARELVALELDHLGIRMATAREHRILLDGKHRSPQLIKSIIGCMASIIGYCYL